MFKRNKLLVWITAFLLCTNFITGALYSQSVNAENTALELYVATNGNDSNDGTKETPFATLERARDAIRELKDSNGLPEGGVTVYIREGDYELLNTFELTEQDSGTAKSPIVYRAYGIENVRLLGGIPLKPDNFKKITDKAVISRLIKGVENKVLQYDLTSYKLTGEGDLILNNKLMTIARWPNDDYIQVGEVVDPGAWPRMWNDDRKNDPNWVPPEERDPNHGFTIRYIDPRIDKWINAKHIKLFGYWYYEWAEQTVDIKSMDIKEKTITSLKPSGYSVRPEGRYYAFNLVEELDIEGEYYYDIDTGILYFYPPSSLKDSDIMLTVNNTSMVTLDKASNISFINLNFEGANNSAVKILPGADNNLIYNCSFKNIGNIQSKDYPIDINEGKNNGIVSSKVSNVNGAIRIVSGDRQTLEPGNNYVENCEISYFNRFGRATAGYAVDMRGVGNRVSNNKIHKSDKQAIIFLGNDNIIENNEIFDVLLHADDAAAIYSWRDITKRGNVIRNNFIHSLGNKSEFGIKATNTNVGLFAMYFDDGGSGTIVENNIIYNVPAGIFINGGRDNIVNNNIFCGVDDNKSIAISDIVAQPRSDAQWELTKFDIFKSGTNELAVPYNKPPYTKYPNLANVLDDEPRKPKYNIVKNNITNTDVLTDVNWARQVLSEAEMLKNNDLQKTYYKVQEADFVDIKSNNFNIKDITKIQKNSPEFNQIDTKGIGLYTDKLNQKINDAVALLIGSPIAIVNKNKKLVDDKNDSIMPIIENGRTLVPVRFIAENFGATVGWDANTSEVSVSLNDKSIKMILGSKIITINGQESQLDVPAQSINGRTLIPLRALVEALGKKVFWDSKGLIVISGVDNIFDKAKEQALVDELIKQLK